MNQTRKELYDEWREEYKNDPARAVGWRNQEALDARFNCTLRHLAHKDFDGVRILDVGCGVSLNLLRYIGGDYTYVGIDCNEESLRDASETWKIPFNEVYDFEANAQLLMDEYLDKVSIHKFDVILVQGVYQEFENIYSVEEHVRCLSRCLNPGGELLIMTPANRVLDAEGKSVLKLSAHDAIGILESTGLPYELALGELGEHLIMRVYRRD